jgi:hypothetical protein
MVQVKILNYQCPICHQQVSLQNAEEPLKCISCGKVLCHSCAPHDICRSCKTKIDYNDYKKLDELKAKTTLAWLTFASWVIGFLAGLIIIVIGIISPMKYLIAIGAVLMISPFIVRLIVMRRDNKQQEIYFQYRDKLVKRIDAQKISLSD